MMVRVPDAAGQLRNAGNIPIRLLRGFFSRIGQLLLAADRLQTRGGKHKRFSNDDGLGPPTGLDGAPATQASGQFLMSAKRSSDSTGNVRLLTPDDPAETLDNIRRPKLPRTKPKTARPAAAKPRRNVTAEAKRTSGARRTVGKHRAGAAAQAPPTMASTLPSVPESSRSASQSSASVSSAAARADLLMPGYESLSLPAIRARLRGLDETQLRILLACEKSSANRVDIVTLFERRIAKLEAAERDAT
jgi:hypothetical protein